VEATGLVWSLTILGIVGLLAFDFFVHVRKAHSPTLREAALWSGLYISIAVLFGIGVTVFGGRTMGTEYFAGYFTEKALSVDNLFVFLVIMASFRVPRPDQQKVLLSAIGGTDVLFALDSIPPSSAGRRTCSSCSQPRRSPCWVCGSCPS